MAAVTDVTPEKKVRFLSELSKMPNIARACRLARISRQTAYRYRESEAEFAAAWDEALTEGVESLEESAWKFAQRGDTTMAIFLLKAHNPEKYRETVKTVHSGSLEIDDSKAREAREKLERGLARLAERSGQDGSTQ
ncbi:MAG: hypothetical protein ABI835_19740 [Chloroflexota bacterium]